MIQLPYALEPEARGLDLASTDAAYQQLNLIRKKPALHYMYRRFYELMLAAERDALTASGEQLEIGSGGGFLKDLRPCVTTSDIRPIIGVDHVIDARELPYPDGSLRAIFAMHVVHHIPDVRAFLGEVVRCCPPGGGLVAIEPYWSPLARLVYTRFHPEPFDPSRSEWAFESTDPMSSNQALSYIMLRRDRAVFEAEFPELEVIWGSAFSGLSYLLGGGIWRRSLLPQSLLIRLWDVEMRSEAWRRWLALHCLFVLRRRQ